MRWLVKLKWLKFFWIWLVINKFILFCILKIFVSFWLKFFDYKWVFFIVLIRWVEICICCLILCILFFSIVFIFRICLIVCIFIFLFLKVKEEVCVIIFKFWILVSVLIIFFVILLLKYLLLGLLLWLIKGRIVIDFVNDCWFLLFVFVIKEYWLVFCVCGFLFMFYGRCC